MTFNKKLRLLLCSSMISTFVVGALVLTGPVAAQENKVVAKVGAVQITAADIDQALSDMAQQFQNFPEAQRRARVLDSLIDVNVLAAEAETEGLGGTDEMKRRMALIKARTMHNAYFQAKIQPLVTDAAIKERFDKEMAQIKPEKEVSARHILVKTEDEAKAIIAELDGGADFVELAKSKSTGPSGPKGGDLGFFGKGRMVPEFENAVFDMEKGAYTKTPVKTQFGYHIIKVDDVREKPLPTFEATKDQIRQVLLAEAYANAIEKIRAKVGVEVLDETLKLPAGE